MIFHNKRKRNIPNEKGRRTTDMPKKLLEELANSKDKTNDKRKAPEVIVEDKRNFSKKFVNRSLKRKQLRKQKRGAKKAVNKLPSNKVNQNKSDNKSKYVKEEIESEEDESELESDEPEESGEEFENNIQAKRMTRAEEEEEKYMRNLEKKLKIKSGSNILKASTFVEDGFGDLFDGLDLKFGSNKISNNEQMESDEEDEEENEPVKKKDESLEFENSHYYSTRTKETPKKEEPSENTEKIAEAKKYIPPHLRKKDDKLEQLKRVIRGLINRLSENNIESILFEIDALYQNNSRNSVTTSITEIILDLISDKSTLIDTFVILHCTIIAALYKLVGTELAAHFVQTLIEKFLVYHEKSIQKTEGKDNDLDVNDTKVCLNLLTLISELYNLEVISCVLIYDLVKDFLSSLHGVNIELLLKIVRAVGPSLRNDDPSAMKDIIVMAQTEMKNKESVGSREKFMMEVLNDLKNNKLKKNSVLNQQNTSSEECIKRMKIFLKNLQKKRHVNHTEPLRVSLEDIKQVSVKGKWWLVGAAWKDNMYGEEATTSDAKEMDIGISTNDSNTLLNLAKQQGMNTEMRRHIFTVIMGSEDFSDAYEKLLKMNLNEKQMRDVPRVLIHCCGSEKTYNPYYTLLAIKFNAYKTSYKITFQYALWDFFRELGEANVGGLDTNIKNETINVPVRKILNTGKMYGELLAKCSININVLKTLSFTALEPRTRLFLQIILANMLMSSTNENITLQVSKIKELKDLVKGLRFFIHNFILKEGTIKHLPFNDVEKSKLLDLAKFFNQLLVE